MGRTRARRQQARSVGGSSSCSGDDSEHQQTMKIIEKMSKKYLHPQAKKKNSTPVTRSRTRTLSPKDAAYEADIEGTSESPSQSDSSSKSMDHYDFDQSDDNLRLVLFPETDSVKKPRSKPTSKMGTKENKASKRKASAKASLATRSGGGSKANPSVMSSKKRKMGLVATDPIETVGRKKPKPETNRLTTRNTAQVSFNKTSKEISLIDSGIFMSPIEKLHDSSMATPDSTTFTTPSLSISTSTKMSISQAEVSTSFDSLLEPSPALSPVKSIFLSPKRGQKTVLMELDSPPMKTPIAEKTYERTGLFLTPLEKLEKKKAKTKHKRVTKTRVDVWASKMKAEFDEIEMYDLSIEDQ